MSRTWIVLLGAVLALGVFRQSPTSAQTAYIPAVRIAYTTFESPEGAKADVDPMVAFLTRAAASLGKTTKQRIEFEVVLGSYYQVWAWFRDRQIDAAIVSPFIAYLLEREGTAVSVLEFREHDEEDGQRPMVAASRGGGSDPRVALDTHLQALLTEARAPRDKAAAASQLHLVAHLSSSGFVMPTSYAADWLTGQGAVTSDVAERFWTLFFERAQFTLHHGVTAPTGNDPTTHIYFSYSGRRQKSRDADVERGGLVDWQRLDAGPRAWSPPLIPNDVLVVRRRLVEEVLQAGDRDQLAEQLLNAADGQCCFNQSTVYTGVRRFNGRTQYVFRDMVDRLFGATSQHPALQRLGDRWFKDGKFDFTIDETLGFLRQDQRNSGVSRLALVLSGGGVKSVYQARLLDHLYGRDEAATPRIRNVENRMSRETQSREAAAEGPLIVHTIVGTSGGAMLAFFASLLPAISNLTDLATTTASKQLFPQIDVPRLLSVVAILMVFVVLLHAAKAAFGLPRPPSADDPWHVAPGVMVLLMAPLVLMVMAVGIRLLRVPHIEGVRGVRAFEGALYGIAAVLVHVTMTCVSRPRKSTAGTPSPQIRDRAAEGVAILSIGVAIVATTWALRVVVGDSDPTDRVLAWLPLLGLIGIVVTLAGFLVAASGRWRDYQLLYVRDYGAALLIAIGVLGASYIGMKLTKWLGWVDFLELTLGYWIFSLGFGVVASLLMLWVSHARSRLGTVVHLGVYSLVRDRVGGLTLSLGAGMAAFFATAVLVWVAFVAPAVYGSERAYDALEHAVDPQVLRSGGFRTDLIVTGALLKDTSCPTQRTSYRSGPLYSCFEGPGGCIGTLDKWQTFRRPVPERALQAVFASGSPFPIFPAHNVTLPNGCVVPLIDGGYAHNVPLEAAANAEARQVLVINASPEPVETEATSLKRLLPLTVSELVQGAPRVFAFMFSQAQEVDRTIARRLMVASFSPPPTKQWPFLMDFRPEKIRLVESQAEDDIKSTRRIGHIEVWGTPLVYSVVRPAQPERTPAAPTAVEAFFGQGLLPDVRQAIEKILQRPAPAAAAFDLDNTMLRGDIGDMLFFKLVAEMRYQGDNDEFWALIENPVARQELRSYWRRFSALREGKAGQAPHRYYDPTAWPPGFADYVVLFMQQYSQMLNQPDGARTAYPWVVKLMTGLTEDAIRSLSHELWTSEMQRATASQDIRSEKGMFRLEGGIRVHGELVDLVPTLQQRGWDVWLVTASNQYVAEEAAAHLGIPRERVLGIRPRVVNGVVTADLEQPIPYRSGKVDALASRGVKPELAFGDSMTDLEMLRSASLAVVIDRERIPHGEMTHPPDWQLQPPTTLELRVVNSSPHQ